MKEKNSWKKFKVTWYEGSIEKINKVLREKKMTAKNIKQVNYLAILPTNVRRMVVYTREILWSDKRHTIDYGSHFEFLEVLEVE